MINFRLKRINKDKFTINNNIFRSVEFQEDFLY